MQSQGGGLLTATLSVRTPTQSGHQASLSVTFAEQTDLNVSAALLLSGDTLKSPSLCCSCWVERLLESSLYSSC